MQHSWSPDADGGEGGSQRDPGESMELTLVDACSRPLASRRGSRCLDWWQAPDLLELAAIRAQVARFDAACARIAAEIQCEERREQKRRERHQRASPAVRNGALGP